MCDKWWITSEVAILLKEKEGANGFKASLRSHETINVSDICMLLGGGGHRGAAGCFVSGALDQAEKFRMELINKYKKYIQEEKFALLEKKIAILEDELKLRIKYHVKDYEDTKELEGKSR